MVIHDGNTQRTSGMDYQAEETNSDIFRKLDVGAFKGEKFKGEKIPFLEEVITVIPPRKRLIIELKVGTECLPYLKEVIKQHGKNKYLRLIACDSEMITAAKKCIYKGVTRNFGVFKSSNKVNLKNMMKDEK